MNVTATAECNRFDLDAIEQSLSDCASPNCERRRKLRLQQVSHLGDPRSDLKKSQCTSMMTSAEALSAADDGGVGIGCVTIPVKAPGGSFGVYISSEETSMHEIVLPLRSPFSSFTVFLPDSAAIGMWRVAMISATMFTLWATSYFIVFGGDMDALAMALWAAVELMFLADMFVSLRTAVYRRGELIVDRERICRLYWKDEFAWDMAAIIPIRVVSVLLIGNRSPWLDINKILRLKSITHRYDALERINVPIFHILRFFTLAFTMSHVFGCLWFVIGTRDGFGADPWGPSSHIAEMTHRSQYLKSLYWAMSTMSGQAADDFPIDRLDSLVTIAAIVVGTFFFAYIVSGVSALLLRQRASLDAHTVRVQRGLRFMSDQGVPLATRRRVLQFYQYCWETCRGTQCLINLQCIPSTLRIDILKATMGSVIDKIAFFQQMSSPAQNALLARFKHRVFVAGETLMKMSGVELVVFFKGVARIIHGRELVPGDYLSARFTVAGVEARALSFCETFIIERTDMEAFSAQFPHDAFKFHLLVAAELQSKQASIVRRRGGSAMAARRWAFLRSHLPGVLAAAHVKGTSGARIGRFLSLSLSCRNSSLGRLFQSILGVAVLYNAIVVPIMCSFMAGDPTLGIALSTPNMIADIIYALDLAIQMVLVVRNPSSSCPYARASAFALRVIASVPIVTPSRTALWRLPRLIRILPYVASLCVGNQPLFLQRPAYSAGEWLAFFAYLVHIVSCLFFSFTLFEGYGTTRWLPSSALEGAPLIDQYGRSVFFALKVLTRIGRPTYPESDAEIVASCVLTMIGFVVLGTVITIVGIVVANTNRYKSSFRGESMEHERLLERNHLPITLQHRLRAYLDADWSTFQGIRPSSVLDDLPALLRSEINRHICGHILHSIPQLQCRSHAAMTSVLGAATFEVYAPRELVIEMGDSCNKLFLMLAGEVDVQDAKAGPFRMAAPGYFGEESIRREHSMCTQTIISLSTCEFMVIGRKDFLRFTDDDNVAKLE